MKRTEALTRMAVVILVTLAGVSFGDNTKKVIVMNLDVSSSQYVSFGKKASKYIRSALEELPQMEVTSEKELKKLSKSLGFPMTYTEPDSVAAELGKQLEADFMVMGFAVKLGRKYKITLRVLQVETAQMAIVKGVDIEDNKKSLRKFAQQVAEEAQGFARAQADRSYQIGLQYLQSGDNENALLNFQQATAIDPSYGAAWIGQVAAHYAMEQYDEAMALVGKTIELDPSIGQAYYYKAVLLQREERCEEALPYFHKSVEADTSYHPAYYNWAQCLRALGEVEQAVAKMDLALVIHDDPAYRSALARIYEDTRDLGKAFKVYYDVVQEDSTQSYAWRRLIPSGSEYLVLGEFDAAGQDTLGFSRPQIIDLVKEAIRFVIKDAGLAAAPIYDILGKALYDIGEYQEALDVYKEWEQVDPESPEVIGRQAKVLTALGRQQEAIGRLQRMVEHDPENVNALVAITIAYMEMDNLKMARKYSADALRKAPGEPLPMMVAGEVKEREAEELEERAKRHVEDTSIDYVKRYEEAEKMLLDAIEKVKEAKAYMEKALPLFQQRGETDRVNYVEKKIRLLSAEPERLQAVIDSLIYAGG